MGLSSPSFGGLRSLGHGYRFGWTICTGAG
jgi:hypothetical protein